MNSQLVPLKTTKIQSKNSTQQNRYLNPVLHRHNLRIKLHLDPPLHRPVLDLLEIPTRVRDVSVRHVELSPLPLGAVRTGVAALLPHDRRHIGVALETLAQRVQTVVEVEGDVGGGLGHDVEGGVGFVGAREVVGGAEVVGVQGFAEAILEGFGLQSGYEDDGDRANEGKRG